MQMFNWGFSSKHRRTLTPATTALHRTAGLFPTIPASCYPLHAAPKGSSRASSHEPGRQNAEQQRWKKEGSVDECVRASRKDRNVQTYERYRRPGARRRGGGSRRVRMNAMRTVKTVAVFHIRGEGSAWLERV